MPQKNGMAAGPASKRMASGKIAVLSSGEMMSLPCSLRGWRLLLSISIATKSKIMPPAILKALNEMVRHYPHRSLPDGVSTRYFTTAWRDNSIMLLQ
jgi:hypothetical protein